MSTRFIGEEHNGEFPNVNPTGLPRYARGILPWSCRHERSGAGVSILAGTKTLFIVPLGYGVCLTCLAHLRATAVFNQHNRSAVASQPDFPEAHNNLGNLLARQGRVEEALAHSLEACRLKHEWAQAHYNLANALFRQKKLAEAETEYEEALRLKPDYLEVH